MTQLILAIHVSIALTLIVLILIQHGKGADMGAGFGAGASQTVFGSQGSLSFLLKVTISLAMMFFATSIVLGNLAARDKKLHNSFSQVIHPTAAAKSTVNDNKTKQEHKDTKN